MGKTYRKNSTRFDDELSGRGGHHKRHTNNRKQHGMKILNDDTDNGDDSFDDNIDVTDQIVINTRRDTA